MAAGFERSYNIKELHSQGEPQSLVELESIPHLHSRAEGVRKILHANKTLRDIDKQNKQDYENLVSLCNSDLLFYLKITNQYYLLSTLFKDPKINSKWAHFMNESRYQHQQRQQLEQASVFKVKAGVSSTNQELNSAFSWGHPHPSLSEMEKLVHYERELERITVVYHNARANIYNRAIDENIEEIDNVIEIMERHGGVDRERIDRARDVRGQLVRRRDEVRHQREVNPDVAEQRVAVIQEVHQDARTALNSMLSPDYLDGNQLEQIIMRGKAREQRVVREDSAVHRIYTQNKDELKAVIHNALDNTKKVTNDLIGVALEKLQRIDPNHLTEDQKNTLNSSIEKIQKIRQDIVSSTGLSAMHEPLNLCMDIIKNVGVSIPEVANSLKAEVATLEKFVTLSKSKQMPSSQVSTANMSSQSPVKAVSLGNDPQIEPSAPSLNAGAETNHLEPAVSVLGQGDTAAPEPNATSLEVSEGRTLLEPSAPSLEVSEGRVLPEPSAPPLEVNEGRSLPEADAPAVEVSEGRILHEPSAPSLDSIEGRSEREVLIPGADVNNSVVSASVSVSAAINMTKQMKFNLNSQKELGGVSEEQDLLLNKDNINRVFGDVLKKIENAQMKKRISPDDMLIAQQIKILINEVKSDPDYQNSLDKIQEIHSKVNELSTACEYLEDLNESIEPISEYLSQATEQSSSVSMYQK